jgi:DNA polymerase-4
MPLRTAYQRCPQAVFLPVDYAEYARVSAQIKAILNEISPIMEDVGIDEAYLDITTNELPSEPLAALIKHRIQQATGLTCSIGIAPNKRLAKIASDLQKPDGLSILTEEDIAERIWPLPVGKIPGVGPVTAGRLQAMGIATIGQLAQVPREQLLTSFGASYGQFLYEASRGSDESPLITHWEPKSRSREITFQRDIGDWQTLAKTLAALCREVADELRQEGYQGRTVTVKVRFSDFETHTRELTLAKATAAYATIKQAAFACLSRVELPKKVRLIGVRVGKLEKINP